MRTETLWGGERRAARMHWWRVVLDRPASVSGDDLFDEELAQRFSSPEVSQGSMNQDSFAVRLR